MTFHEDWFSDESCQVLDSLARSVETVSGTVVEIGCWAGKSTCALANAVWPINVRAVDTWQGSPGEISAFIASKRDVFTEFQQNVVAHTRGNVWPFRMGWRDYFASIREPVKFIHIDATHTYEEVRDNIETVLPLMVPGGIICGDDVHHPPVQRAVLDVLGGHTAMCKASLWYWRAP